MSIADKLATIAENEQKVYEAGKQAEYDKFWDNYQSNGKRTDYGYSFYGDCWNINTFKPKYDIKSTNFTQMFPYFNNLSETQIDLVALAEENGIKIEFSSTTGHSNYSFATGGISRIGVVDMSTIISSSYCFYGAYSQERGLQTIDKIISSETTAFHNTTFGYAKWLENVTFEGVIAISIYFQYSPLTPESMKSVINCLKNFKGTGKEYSCEVKFRDDCWAALEADSTAPNGSTWKEYVQTELCWNI